MQHTDLTPLYLIIAAVTAGITFAFWAWDRIDERKAPKPQPKPQPQPAPFRFEYNFSADAIDHLVHELYILEGVHPTPQHRINDLKFRDDLEGHLQTKCDIALSDHDYRNIMSCWVNFKHFNDEDRATHLKNFMTRYSN
jgi:hypothetical protein